MSLQLVAFLAAAAVLGLFALSRVVRVRRGLEARVYGWKMWLLVFGVVVVVPIAIAVAGASAGGKGGAPFLETAIAYELSLLLFVVLMGIGGALVRRFVLGKSRPVLLLALVGREPSAADIPFDPPMTDAIRASVNLVDARNAVFPRGRGFMEQTDLPGFQSAWNALDEATRSLEGLIAEGVGLGTGVAMQATETAGDARSRLETLHRAAAARGQAWAM